MNESPNEQETLKQYLLGSLTDNEEMRLIEEKSLLDDDFDERLLIAEDELIDEYVDGTLTETERRNFLQFFLISPERKEKLRLIRDLRKYASRDADVHQEVKEFSKEKKDRFDWRGLFSAPRWQFAAILVLVLGGIFAVWLVQLQIERPESNVDRALAQLRIAYQGQRPTRSRSTVNFDYAPFSDTRTGNKAAATDSRARNRANEFLLSATENPSDAEAYHALGLLYLAEKKFDEALDEFNRALNLAPDNARLHSDIGAAYLEKAESIGEEKADEHLRNLDSSLRHINRALELDKNLPEALFNKALVLQKTHSPGEARKAWEKYLEKDSKSQWADEARQNLRELEQQKSQNLSADELEKAFLEAFRRKDEARAGRLISRNREVITEQYLPQRLAMSLVEAPVEKKNEYLEALIYAGEVEKKQIEDSFAADIGAFYAKASETDFALLKEAQISVREGYKLCLDGRIKDALEKFNHAREIFLQTGNVWEAKLSEYLIVYCLIYSRKSKESLPVAEEIINFCRRSDYKWLLSNVLLWYAGAQRVTGKRAEAKNSYAESLKLAEKISDSLLLQSVPLELARQSRFLGQNSAALGYLQRVLKNADAAGASLRQRWRDYSDGAEILANAGYDNLAKVVLLENTQLSEDLKNPLLTVYSQVDAGIVHARTGDYDEARNWFTMAKKNVESVSKESDRKEILAKSSLELGHLERKLGHYPQAAEFYNEALGYVVEDETPYFLYEILKGRLLANIPLNREAEIEKQITETLALAEKYREEISAEQERNSFFDNEQTIYDIAVDNDFRRGRYEQAYDYLETSNSRSLLDWLKKGVSIKEDKKKIEITFEASEKPLRLDRIRAEMPAEVQILQYSVLENKVLIWLVSKDKFTVVASEIPVEKLKEKVTTYNNLVSVRDNQKQEAATALGRELYDLLISPIAGELDTAREICLIPQKILFHLPFAALTAPDGKPFLKQFNFFYAQSANVFLLFTNSAREKSASTSETLLSVGNPRFDRTEFSYLQDLPKAEDEAREIAQLYPNSPPLLGAAVTQTALQDSLKNAEIIHFAGHYLVRHGEPLSSGLVLTRTENAEDGILTNAELISQKLPQLKLVVLSACQTGVEQYYNGEGMVGLARTFLAAGAPLVVASQWQVDSSASAELMKKFHFYRRQQKLSTTNALRRAQLEMLNEPDGRFRQPYFWAAFATYGGYAEF